MSRYELDRLGFYQFEWLIQVLAKSEFGLAVEAWGTTGDHGRDAHSSRAIVSAQNHAEYPGGVIFQAKFVAGANAAGATSHSAIVSACKKEAQRISEHRARGRWKGIRSYFLYTNAPLTAKTRTAVKEALEETLGFEPVSLGYSDISALLDLQPQIARSFPQILTYQHLLSTIDSVVTDAVSHDILQRTETLLSKAKGVVPVFVPTSAFDRTWEVLGKHHFAVLTGPPEMGKTSIAWMVALSHLATGWQIIDCERPDDFFRLFQAQRSQIFLADDAFGRTEYDAEVGRRWERQLSTILHRLDKNHLLIWTSRKHILERARAEMDLGSGTSFPMPAEVIVQADKLSVKEKALILYRHAVYADLEAEAKILLRQHVRLIINEPHFTPLRIYLFCRNSLPLIVRAYKDKKLIRSAIPAAIHAAIREVTTEMTKTYKALPKEMQWLLTALLDEASVRTVADVEKRFSALHAAPPSRPIVEMLRELDETFVRLAPKLL